LVQFSERYTLGFSMGDTELPISVANFKYFQLYENINIDFPIAELSFTDVGGLIMEGFSFVGGECVTVFYDINGGVGSFDLIVGSLYPRVIDRENTNEVLMYLHWPQYSESHNAYCGGFYGEVSELARKLAETLGASSYDIEEVKTKLNFVAVGTPFMSALQYLAEVAKGAYSGFAWFWDKENEFHFRSVSSFFTKPIFRTVDLRDRLDSENDPDNLTYGQVFQNMARSEHLWGFKGTEGMYFDWNDNQFILQEAYPSQIDKYPLANRFLLRQKEETSENFNAGWLGRADPQYPSELHNNYVEGYVLDRLNWAVRFILSTNGDWRYRLGQIIEIVRPSAVPERAFDEQCSGSWMIEGIVHRFDQDDYKGQLQLIRNGVNLRDESEFVR